MTQRRSRGSEDEAPPPIIVRRSKKGDDHGGHHGGAWKIAYADFVTAMMAFFLLMWLLGSTSKFDKQGIEDYFNTPLSSLLGGSEGTAAARPSVVQARRARHLRYAPRRRARRPRLKRPRLSTSCRRLRPPDAARLQQLKKSSFR